MREGGRKRQKNHGMYVYLDHFMRHFGFTFTSPNPTLPLPRRPFFVPGFYLPPPFLPQYTVR